MKLTPQQVAAAKARGFVMFPATQGQIDRMTMQRRVFDVDGKPHVVSRDGLYFETHATLAPMIADALAAMPAAPEPEPMAAAPVVVAAAPDVAVAAEPAAVEAEAEPEAAAEDAPRRPVRRRLTRPETTEGGEEPRKPARRRAMPAQADADMAVAAAEPAAATPQTTLSLPVDDSELGLEAAARRRMRSSEAPRWQVAGALRRGRQPRAQ